MNNYAPDTPIEIPSVAPISAHRKLANALVQAGLSEGAATALARVVVNPADVRKRLASPSAERTNAGTLLTVPTFAWSPLLSVAPDNKRETINRLLPVSGGDLPYPPLPELTSQGLEPELHLAAQSREQLAATLGAAEGYLKIVNDLTEQVEDTGILRPLTVVAVRASYADGSAPTDFAATADGSSRTAAAHRISGLTASAALFQLGQDDRAFRRWMADLAERADAGDSSDGLRHLANVLIVPADIVVGFEAARPNDNAAMAIRSLVGLMHVQPPTEWSPGSQLDAQGDEALNELADRKLVSTDEARYLAGLIRLDEAAALGLPHHADERAATIVRTFAANVEPVKVALRRLTGLSQIRGKRVAAVAAELAIRSFRSDRDHASKSEGSKSRVGLQLAYVMREIWEEAWSVTQRSPEELRSAAQGELSSTTGTLGPTQIELAVLGGFELARMKILTQYSLRVGVQVQNLASPATILRTLATTTWGIEILAQAIREGRNGAGGLIAVTPNGEFERDGRNPKAMTADWLRANFDPAAKKADLPAPPSNTPEEAFVDRQAQIAATVGVLEGEFSSLREIKNATGVHLVRLLGWRSAEAKPLARRLERLRDELRNYAFMYDAAEGQADEDQELEELKADDNEDWQ